MLKTRAYGLVLASALCAACSTDDVDQSDDVTVEVQQPLTSTYQLRNQHCLDSNTSGKAYVNKCQSENKFQLWSTLWYTSDHWFHLRDLATGRCLDSNANGAVYTNPCQNGNEFQTWHRYPAAYGDALYKNWATGLCSKEYVYFDITNPPYFSRFGIMTGPCSSSDAEEGWVAGHFNG